MSYALIKHKKMYMKGIKTVRPEQRLTQYNHEHLGICCHYTRYLAKFGLQP